MVNAFPEIARAATTPKDKIQAIFDTSMPTIVVTVCLENNCKIVNNSLANRKAVWSGKIYTAHCYFQGVDLTPKREFKKKVQNHSIFGVKFTPVMLTPFLE